MTFRTPNTPISTRSGHNADIPYRRRRKQGNAQDMDSNKKWKLNMIFYFNST
jgi:hypothetical protein